jgi:hypothetical protein
MPISCDSDTYSADCIARVAAQAGFKGKALETAIAVALAESSGRTKVVSGTGCCVGLWQINTRVHPYSKAQMQDPVQNAAAAYKISNGGSNWQPWDVYKSGVYEMYMTTAEGAATRVATDNSGGATPFLEGSIMDTVSEAAGIDDALAYPQMVLDWISNRDNIFRIVKVIAGGVLLVAGLVLVAKPVVSGAAGGVVKTVVRGIK